MSQLPNELLRAIVAHLERKTLLDLTIVSKRIHAMALPILYKDITFHLEDELPISLLRRDIQTNAGIQYTKAFAIYFFPCYFDDYDEIRADIDYIIPYLVNVRRLCLTRQCASPGVLSLLPTSARLTHLILDHTHCSEDLSQFLSCNPTLESIAIHNGDLVDGHVIELVARNLPKLYSLEIVLNDLVHIQSPMPSITNLGILDIESISASGFLLNFPSLRRLCLPESGLPAVLALASFLPNIEFLEVYPMDQESRLIASDFAPFSKLKYVKYGMIIVRNSLPLELFDSVKSLVVVDAADPHTTSRWFRGSITPLKHDTPGDDAYLWEGWWDYEEALIEEAIGNDRVLGDLWVYISLDQGDLFSPKCPSLLFQFSSAQFLRPQALTPHPSYSDFGSAQLPATVPMYLVHSRRWTSPTLPPYNSLQPLDLAVTYII
ncbi:hypothetical protein AB1N83_005721 [Pleurotus pulmonarius]